MPRARRHRRNRRTAARAGQEQPSRVGPYRIAAVLGRGGMGVVYRGEHGDSGAPAAIKTVRTAGPHELSSLRREIHALIQIQHPGVVRFIEQGVDQGRPWYAMELLARRTLEDLHDELFPGLRRHGRQGATAARPTPGPLTEQRTLELDEERTTVHDQMPTTSLAPDGPTMPAQPPDGPTEAPAPAIPVPPYRPDNLKKVLTLGYQLCQTLSFIHGHGIVHRDLKPSNVFLRADDTPVLTDFGLVSRLEGEQGREVLQITGGFRGTPGYMAPEQILGLSVDARADLYALGCILYELLTGTPPFPGENPVSLLWAHIHDPVQPPSERVAGLPPALDPLLCQLLAKQRRDRFGHADDVAAALLRLGAMDSAPGSQPAGQPGPRPRTYLYHPEMVGRDKLMASLEVRLQQLHQSRGGMILVGAESGAGKTYLATALTAAAIRRDVQVVIGECLPLTTTDEASPVVEVAPLHPFRQLLHTIADRCVEGGADVTERLLGAWGKVLAAYEPVLATLPGVREHPEPAELPPEAAHARLMKALEQVLARFVTDDPLLLVLDDLQWADALSMQFLGALAEADLASRGLLVLGTYRTEEITAALRALVDTPGIEKIELERLDADAIATMVGDMLGLRWSPSGLVRFLAEQSRGNPFFVTEYMRAAVAEGLLFREGGRWRMGDGGKMGSLASYQTLPLPRSLEELMSRRLARLGPAARMMAELMAVLGREVETDLLLQAHGALWTAGEPDSAAGRERQEEQRDDAPQARDFARSSKPVGALDALGELLSRQVLEQARGSRLRFVHDKLRETAYARISPARLPVLHRAAGEALESRYRGGDGFALHYPELVRHWRAAGDDVRALRYLDRAGQHAMRTGAHRDAVRYLREALALHTLAGGPGGLGRRARWERQIGAAYLALDQGIRSRQHLERAVALCGMPVPRTRQDLALALGREALVQVVHRLTRRGSGPAMARGLTRPQPWPWPWNAPVAGPGDEHTAAPGQAIDVCTEAARAYTLLHGAYRTLERQPVYLTERNRAVASSARRDEAPQIRGFATEGKPIGALGHPWHVLHAVLRSLNLAERGAPAATRAMSYGGAQAMAASLSLHRLAARYGRLAHQTLDGIAAPHARSLVLLVSAATHLSQGRWQPAMTAAAACARIASTHGFRQRVGEAWICMGYVHLAAGRLDHASLMYRRVHDASARSSAIRHRTWAIAHIAQIAVTRGQLDEAVSALAELETLPGGLDTVDEIIIHAAVARARFHQGEYDAAHAAAARAWIRLMAVPPATIELLVACPALLEVSMGLWSRCAGVASRDISASRARARGARQVLAFVRSMARAFPVLAPDTLYWRGVHAALSGQRGRALRYWKKSLAIAHTLTMPCQQARAHLALSRMLAPGTAARLHAARAKAVLTRIGISENMFFLYCRKQDLQ